MIATIQRTRKNCILKQWIYSSICHAKTFTNIFLFFKQKNARLLRILNFFPNDYYTYTASNTKQGKMLPHCRHEMRRANHIKNKLINTQATIFGYCCLGERSHQIWIFCALLFSRYEPLRNRRTDGQTDRQDP